MFISGACKSLTACIDIITLHSKGFIDSEKVDQRKILCAGKMKIFGLENWIIRGEGIEVYKICGSYRQRLKNKDSFFFLRQELGLPMN